MDAKTAKTRKTADAAKTEKSSESGGAAVSGSLAHKYTRPQQTDIYSVKFSSCGSLVASAGGDSHVAVHAASSGSLLFSLDPHHRTPCTSVCFVRRL